jgi:hypothetical protein
MFNAATSSLKNTVRKLAIQIQLLLVVLVLGTTRASSFTTNRPPMSEDAISDAEDLDFHRDFPLGRLRHGYFMQLLHTVSLLIVTTYRLRH